MAQHQNRPLHRLPLGIILLALVAFTGMVLNALKVDSGSRWETARTIVIATLWLGCFCSLNRRRPKT